VRPARRSTGSCSASDTDLHLRDTELLTDLRLGAVVEEAQHDDPALPLVEDTQGRTEVEHRSWNRRRR
jgi:hypothetical protein